MLLEGRGAEEWGASQEAGESLFHSFGFCLPLIAKLLFLREMQGATLNQYFCGAFINYGLKSTNLSSPPHVSGPSPPRAYSSGCLFDWDLNQKCGREINKYIIRPPGFRWRRKHGRVVRLGGQGGSEREAKIDLCHMAGKRRRKERFARKAAVSQLRVI